MIIIPTNEIQRNTTLSGLMRGILARATSSLKLINICSGFHAMSASF